MYSGWGGRLGLEQQRVEVNSSSYILKLLTYHGKYMNITLSKLEGGKIPQLNFGTMQEMSLATKLLIVY